jgi:aspartyl-tRNA(Asn)/glutamyl-tRNA(Gln) amidotransferase subunit A
MMTVLETAAALRARKVSSSELVKDVLARITALDQKLNAFITVTEDSARVEAKAADNELARGIDRGPLHGIPVAVKDVFWTKGVRTTGGSRIFAEYVPPHNAAAVESLIEAGAIIVGKTNMHELAYGITSENPHFGSVRNPRDAARIAGGSSGGSGAAVAAGLVPIALGTDTGGSIRIPASYCGVVGLKPTYGRVSRYGVMPLGFTLDHVGPLAATVRDAAVALQVLAGYDPRDDATCRRPEENFVPPEDAPMPALRIGLPENFFFHRVAPEVAQAVRAAARQAELLGARVVPLKVPDVAALNTVARLILLAEASALMEPHLHKRDQFGADVLALLDQGRLVPATDYVNAQRLRRKLGGEFRAIWRHADCLFIPTTPIPPPLIGQRTVTLDGQEDDVRIASTRFTRGFNALGWPALSMPCGSSPEGLPYGLQIVGPPLSEARLLHIAAALEKNR